MRLIRLLKRDLAKECADWVKDSLISEDQAEKICDRYGINYQQASEQTYGYAVLVGLGYLFIGLAVITLLSANWEDIPRAVRMSGLLLLTFSAHLYAFKKYKDGQTPSAIGLFFLGSLFYGASIMLIAQIYHIDEHYPNGILWWAIGVLPLGLLLESSLLISLTMALAFVWFFVESGLNYYPVLFPLFLAVLGWHVFKVKQSYLLFLSFVIGIGLYLEYTLSWWMAGGYEFHFGIENIVFVIGLFIAYHGFSKWLMNRADQKLIDYGTVLGLWTLRFMIFSLLLLSFEWLWEEFIEADWLNTSSTLFLAVISSVIGVGFSFTANRQFHSTLSFALLYIIGVFMVMQISDDIYALYFQIVTNIVLIIAGIWLIIKGIKESVTHYFFLGVSTILATGLLRYMDLVGDYIGASILFIIFAVILLSAARFWKSHQRSIQK